MKQNNSKGHFRSRNSGRRQNGTHTVGVNTLIDSNGPCGKIKGTAFQIMEKYLAAAKDASGADRVLYENCMQHAEYFFRTHIAALAAEAERRESLNNEIAEAKDDVEETVAKVADEKENEDLPDMENDKPEEESETEDISSDIVALDLSFPDVSKLGQTEDKPAAPVKRRGRKPKEQVQNISVVTKTEAEVVKPEEHLPVEAEDVSAKRKTRCRKVQGL